MNEIQTLQKALFERDEIFHEAITEKDKEITELKEEIKQLEAQNNDLDYLLNSGRNKFEHERNKRLKELEAKLNQPLTNQELLFNLVKKLEIGELEFSFDFTDDDNVRKLYLEDQTSKADENRIYLFTLKIADNQIKVFWDDDVNDKFQKNYLKAQENKKEPVILFDEYERKNSSKLTKIQGILASDLVTDQLVRTSTDVPYMAFIRLEYNEHLDRYWRCKNKYGLPECIAEKCQECEIPVVFRIGGPPECKPMIKKGDSVILEGEFSNSKDSNRPSFTCYSYEIVDYVDYDIAEKTKEAEELIKKATVNSKKSKTKGLTNAELKTKNSKLNPKWIN